jgi:DNA polymerase-1
MTEQQLTEWLARLEGAELFAFDTETTSLEYMKAEIVGVSFAVAPGQAAYLPLRHDYAGAPDQLAREASLARLKPLLESEKHAKLGHHIKYDAHVLARHGIELRAMRYDSMLESYVWNSVVRHDMDSAAERYLGIRTIHYEDVAGKGRQADPFQPGADRQGSGVFRRRRRRHAAPAPGAVAADSRRARAQDAVRRMRTAAGAVLLRMEEHGVLLDRQMLRAQSSELAKRLMEVLADAHKEAGAPFNLDSPKQLCNILFEKDAASVLRKTPTGQPSTAEDVLEELAESYRLPKLILEHRGLSNSSHLHRTNYPSRSIQRPAACTPATTRPWPPRAGLSSQDPNLQNIPIRTPEGRRIRQAFIAPEGHVLLAADYSQIELRIMAHLSGDDGPARAFASDKDIHQATAAEVIGAKLG